MIIDAITDAIRANIGALKPAPKNWFKRHCMLCHTRGHGQDTRNRLGIQFNPDSIAINCFNCGFSAGYTEHKSLTYSFKVFLQQINVSDRFIKQIEFEIFKQARDIDSVRDGDEDLPENKEARLRALLQRWAPADLPPDSLPITEWLEHGLDDPHFMGVVEYALSRKLYDLDKFYWSPSKQFQVNRRLIMPYLYRNKIVGFTARLSYDTDGKLIPKYYQQCPTDFVYNLDSQQDWARKYVIVTEGVLDGYSVDGVSTLGELGQAKIDIINRIHKEVIVCPDRDKKGWDLVEAAIDNNWAVSFPKWDRNIKDAAGASVKYGKLLTTYSVISSAVRGKDKIRVRWDIEQNERNKKR